MTPKVGRFLGQTVLVSIPALFGDAACRPYKLLGFELVGLWLQSDDLSQRLLPEEARDLAAAAPMVFVPFAQIAGVLVPTAPAAQPPPGAAPAVPQPPTAKKTRSRSQRASESGG